MAESGNVCKQAVKTTQDADSENVPPARYCHHGEYSSGTYDTRNTHTSNFMRKITKNECATMKKQPRAASRESGIAELWAW